MVGIKFISIESLDIISCSSVSYNVSSVVVLSCWCIIVLVYCWMYIPDLPTYLVVVELLCCQMYIPDLPTYLVLDLETTRGSSIDTPTMPTQTPTPTPMTHFKSMYIPDSTGRFWLRLGGMWVVDHFSPLGKKVLHPTTRRECYIFHQPISWMKVSWLSFQQLRLWKPHFLPDAVCGYFPPVRLMGAMYIRIWSCPMGKSCPYFWVMYFLPQARSITS